MALFLIVTFMAVGEMSFFPAHIFFELSDHLFSLWDWCWEEGYISVLESYDFVVNITLIGNRILFHVIGAVLLYFTMRKIVRVFRDDTDTSAVNWKPAGAEPEATSPQVQSRWNSALGQKSIIVPPELEEKMKNDPELAKKVMANVENFITTYAATSVRPGRVCSWLISLDENEEIEKYRVTGGGGNISGPTEEQQRQFEAEQVAKRKRREEYARLNEESALKHRLMEQEADERYYQTSITQKAVSIATYEAADGKFISPTTKQSTCRRLSQNMGLGLKMCVMWQRGILGA
ncbi:hypothetical protein C805_01569 [Eubacterium sp. 14-2]|uniref:hypothetical protein n=1 Tax=Eubacterium sp. 14-2 TaxID=1235790 RepID=UPI00033979CD|nr:hypothetical protein [Eubacterium sp. 14-2]EOT27461.1 hypothetical protein C805_01569 [Eubacterium sp. 14-2]